MPAFKFTVLIPVFNHLFEHCTCSICSLSGNLVPDNGAAPLYRFTKTFVGFTKPDYDNLANFCKGRLQDEM